MGDLGTTGIHAGVRLSKSCNTINVLGDLDELNACLGLARAKSSKKTSRSLAKIQQDLFKLGSRIAGFSPSDLFDRTGELEQEIDLMSAKLPYLKNFILPAGCEASARLHLARAVCRRCERSLVALHKHSKLIPYFNRLSDYLFVLARYENIRNRVQEEVTILNQQ